MTLLDNPPAPSAAPLEPVDHQTIWGLDLVALHDYYWAARGVQVVRLGDRSALVSGPELYLLTDHDTLVLARTRPLIDPLCWVEPIVLIARVHDRRTQGYREIAKTDADGRLTGFQRIYGSTSTIAERVAFTRDADVARAWQSMPPGENAWRTLRRNVPATRRDTCSIKGRIYFRNSADDRDAFAHDIVKLWPHPSATITRAAQQAPGVWADPAAAVDPAATFVDNVWLGAGRSVSSSDMVVGPTILWDDPAQRPTIQGIRWRELEASEPQNRPPQVARRSSISRIFKRLFDIAFALFAILLTLPVYPLVMLAIFIEDGRPFFFGHKRETLGGKEFACLKFRSMRKDAEQIKAQLAKQNQADGPQFFIDNDPRLTRVGSLIRKLNIDELPQFFNVLAGHMSIVGPRPSPRKENQYCPPWREARLSVRPGITGLWQVNRTRIRGADFQEWIKYDIEYVEKQSWLLDLHIIWKTVIIIIRGVTSP